MSLGLRWALLSQLLVVHSQHILEFFQKIIKEQCEFIDGESEILRCDVDNILAVGEDE